MATPIEIAHQRGVNAALKHYGYGSAEEVEKAAAELGLFDAPPAPAEKAATVDPSSLSSLAAKLRK